jgi:serine protease Do
MFKNKLTAILIAVTLLVIGLGSGLIIAASFTSSAKTAPSQQDWKTEMAALDARLAALPPQQQAFVLVSKKATPAVVTISSERVVRSQQMDMRIPEEFRRFFGDDFNFDTPSGNQRVQGLGSGVIVSPDGVILTNNHVVEQADSIQVTMPDGRALNAKVVGTDPDSDLAVLRVDEKNLPYLEFGDSDAIEVGEWVMAIGNPFSEALRHTVTAGIVSAKGREVNMSPTYNDFIQTDASINPGNSGGALVNMEGELIGINTAIISQTGTNNGIGFAIPSNLAKQVMDSLLKHGRVIRGWLGVTVQGVSNDVASALGLDTPHGALIVDVNNGSPADKAGLKRGDLVTEINGHQVTSQQDLTNKVGAMAPGEEARLKVLRESGEKEIVVTLGERPADLSARGGEAQPGDQGGAVESIGLTVTPLTPQLAQRLGYENEQGVVISDVAGGSAAEAAGLQRGYLIQEINRRPIRSIEEFNTAIKSAKPGDSLLFYVRAGDNGGYFALKVPSK